jgi:histidinol-phosphate aminotransferase
VNFNFLSEKAKNLTPYVAGLQPQESGWVKLNTNENPYPPSPRVFEVFQDGGAEKIEKLRLYPDTESTVLKKAISAALKINEEKIFCGNSSDEVLALAFQAFFSGKENVLSPEISYGFYPVWGEMYDVGMKFIPLRENFSINADDYKNSNGVIFANPNAPTSLALSIDDIEKILRENANGVVIIDETYIDFVTFENVKSAVSLVDSYENLLITRTFSKSHSLAGLRVGYAIGSAALIDGLRRVRDAFNSYPLDFLAQTCAAAAISDTQYTKEISARIITTREKTVKSLREMDYRVLHSQANFIFMETLNAEKLYKFLLENKILVRHWNNPRIKNFLRVSIGTDTEMEAFLKCVKEF